MSAVPRIKNLQPCWILRNEAARSFWHRRGEDGLCLCMRNQGPQLKVVRVVAEPTGKWSACPDCTRHMKRLAEKEKQTVLTLVEPTPPAPPADEPQVTPWEDKRISIKDVAKLLNRPYPSVYNWATKFLELGYDPDDATFPESSLDQLRELDQKSARHRSPGDLAARRLPPGVVLPEREPEVLTVPTPEPTPAPARVPVVGEFRLGNEHRILAAFLGKTEYEFTAMCFELGLAELRKKFQ